MINATKIVDSKNNKMNYNLKFGTPENVTQFLKEKVLVYRVSYKMKLMNYFYQLIYRKMCVDMSSMHINMHLQ